MTKRARLGGTLLACGIAVGATPLIAQMRMAHGPVVTPDWVERHLDDDHVAILHADMRSGSYEEGHLPGARFLDLTKLVWNGEPAWGTEMTSLGDVQDALRAVGLTNDLHHIVIYADNPLFASRAFLTLEVMGLRGRVHVLDGGLGSWREEGRVLSTEAPEIAPGDVTLRPVEDVMVGAEWIRDRLDDPRVALVDARPDDEYTGADGGMGGMANAGHIPGAHQMYWEELITDRATPLLHDEDELRRLFAEAGYDEGDTVVAYCMVGWRASYTYLAARSLGYDTKFYDGSWHDWGTREGFPYVSGRSPR